VKQWIRRVVRAAGYDIVRYSPSVGGALGQSGITAADRSILHKIRPFTMTTLARQMALLDATRYIARRNIPGCFVECGVWRGGSSMAAALALLDAGERSRTLHLFDTFDGMTAPRDEDKTLDGVSARTYLDEDRSRAGSVWAVAGYEEVLRNMASTGYPVEQIRLVKGPVEQTVPAECPVEPIALLRLDTDWYESTKHELTYLFPQVSVGGVVIIDDYGHWDGARKAVDEYFAETGLIYLMHRIDYTGRLLIKD